MKLVAAGEEQINLMNEVGMEFISIYFGLRGYGPSGRSSPIPTSPSSLIKRQKNQFNGPAFFAGANQTKSKDDE